MAQQSPIPAIRRDFYTRIPQPNSIGRRPAGYSRSPGLVTDAGRLTNAVLRITTVNKVLFISIAGERQVFENVDLDSSIDEANRLNEERGLRGGVHVVERNEGYRLSALECRETAEARV